MRLDERILRRFCRPPSATPSVGTVYGSVEEARAELVREFGEEWLARYVRDKRVLDFGAGYGHHVRALLDLGAREVWGVDIQSHSLE
ncbi:MAG: class I SAM-dependent methyltransferase, partial [Deltaproteobacteria bacterium]|nr:class I SAM-dependent methyltransferase [Deltaproteobacteria bacterium]